MEIGIFGFIFRILTTVLNSIFYMSNALLKCSRFNFSFQYIYSDIVTTWPVRHAAIVEGDVVLGGLMMVHSREDTITCGPIMPQGGIQALEVMLYTLDRINEIGLLPNFSLGAHILDDCDK